MELQNYLTITTPDAMNAIPDQSAPYPLAIGSRHSPLVWDSFDSHICSPLLELDLRQCFGKGVGNVGRSRYVLEIDPTELDCSRRA
jgi:hypothetical protein